MVHAPPVIVVVDDDASIRKALVRLMRSAGYRARAFASAEDFLAAQTTDAGDCLVLDIRMAGRSGLELQDELVARGSTLPIIFITAYEDKAASTQVLAAGAVGVLSKPFDEEALLAMIAVALRPQP